LELNFYKTILNHLNFHFMKKIILLILVLLTYSSGFAQPIENFDLAPDTPDASGVWALPSGNWLVRDNRTFSAPNWQSNVGTPYEDHTSGTGKAAFINRENTGPGVYAEEWLIMPSVNILANRQLRFFTRQTVTGDDGFARYQVRMSSNADPNNLAAYTTILADYSETDLSTLTSNQLDYEEKIINFAVTGNRYIAFVKVCTQPLNVTVGDRWLIDDVKIVERCFEPTTLGTNSVSSTGATLTWVGTSANYTIEYGPSGFLPGTGTIVPNVPDGGATDSYVIPIPLLTPDTCYQFYITGFCGTGDTGSSTQQTGPFNFCTSPLGSTCAGPIVIPPTLPYFTTDDTLQFGNNISTAGPGTTCGATGNFLGGNDVVYTYTNPNATPLNINIQMNPGAATNTGMFVYTSCANIGVSCIAGVGNAQGNIREITSLTLSPNQTIYIVLSSTTATTSYPYTLAIQVVNCAAPTGLNTSGPIGMTDATLVWTNPTSTAWEVAVQTGPGFPTIPSGSGFPVAGPTPTVSAAAAFGAPLVAATTYYFWVRADCGNGTYSLWAGPFAFSTKICEPVDQCNYTFIMTDSFGDGWNGATMQVRQAGIVVATIGSTFTTGAGPISVTVPMCNNIPFDLFWNNGGGFPGEVRVRIQNSFSQDIFAMTAANAAGVGTSIYSGTVDCLNPLCLTPTALAVPTATITTNGAVINWTSSGVPTTGWDLYVVPQGTAAPTSSTIPTYPNIPGPTGTFTIPGGLTADTCYDVYVRSVCSVNGPSNWTTTAVTFCTLPTCPKPVITSVTPVTLHEATVTWGSVGPATGYQVAFLPSPSTLPIDESAWSPVQTATTFTTATGALESGTLYDVYVRSICLGGADIGQPSLPTTFNTIICLPEEQCLYTFTMTDSFGDGWNGARMQVRQNGIVVATIGATFTTGAGPIVVTVPLCHGVPFDLYWSVAGGFPGEVRISVTNNFGQQLYAMTTASAGLVGTAIYQQDEVDCLAPLCLPPTAVIVTPGIFNMTINWTASTFNTAYDIYIVATGSGIPDETTTPTYPGVVGTSFTTPDEWDPSTEYTVYVRAICDANSPSEWPTGVDTETLPTCPQPINLTVLGADTDSATLTWVEVGPATQWEVFVVPADSPVPTPGSGTIVTDTTFDTTVLGALDAGLYDFYVRAICTPDDDSEISGPVSFFIINVDPVCPEVTLEVATTSPGTIDLCPGENCLDLSASFVDFKDTSTYAVDAVAFAPPFPFIGGTELNIGTDDIWGPPVTLPFDFCFFGVNSQQVQVGSNGVVTFTPQPFPGNCPWAFTQTIPNNTSTIPRNSIYGVYQDINPNVATAPLVHSINYQILGTAPCRAFVVNYYQVAQFSCNTTVGLQTSQIVLYETSNIVEVYVQDRTVCTGWNSGSGLIGIQNAAGTQAHVPPGRNTGPWEAHNEGWRFTPDGASNVVFNWFQGPTPIGNHATDVNVCVSETTLMTAQAIYTGCGGQQTIKEVTVLLKINDIDIAPIEDVTSCECYALPELLPLQHYYTAAGGPTGGGTEIPAGTLICDPTTTVYVYAATGTDPVCSDEEDFVVNITGVTAPTLPDVTECTAFILPPLEAPFFYFTEPDGGGINLEPGAEITTTGSTIIYVLGVNGDCISQTSFTINIGAIDAFEQDDVSDCNGFILPALPANQTYHTEPNGAGAVIEPGTNITTPGVTTIYIHAEVGACIDESDFTITIDNQLVPTFDAIANICVNGTAPILPTQSTNSPTPITGTWSPATIDTTVPGTFTFTFTPDGTIPCAVETTITVTIDPLTTPTFDQIPAICLNATAPVLPLQSINSPTPITGTWSPATINTSVEGTTTYTFTPDAGQTCTTTTTMDIVINSQITPVFTQIANICQNATAPVLPSVSNAPESIPGTWSPATIDTSVAGTVTYTFTPDLNVAPCAISVTMDITIDPTITPAPAPIADVCVGGTASLPSTVDGLTGTWSPATVDTSVAGTFNYCFTPDAGQGCTVQACININVIAPQLPVFNNIPTSICFGATVPALPTTSANGTPITGTWNPIAIDNTLGGIYTFTPDAGQCATVYVVNITVNPVVTPTFVQLGPICQGDTAPVLPTVSAGITGTWSPATVSNQATVTYTFTPDAGQCANNATMTIVVNPTIVAQLNPIGPICNGGSVPTLPAADANNNPGTWNPAIVSTTQTGTYTFTPDGICVQSASIVITVTDEPQFSLSGGCNGNDYTLTAVPTNGFDPDAVTYTWTDSDGNPVAGANGASIVVTATGSYNLVVTAGGCPGEGSITVTTVSCGIQKGISPGDGTKNDFFDLAGLNVRRLEIFNRYGTKVYSQSNYSREWYGQSDKGDELPDGTYYYVIERDTETKTGWIYINRVK
jgi:gliding motility-associated-like protein